MSNSAYTATLPQDTILDAGVLMLTTTPIGVSRGGLSVSLEKEWRNVDFDGKRSDVMALDRVVGVVCKISGNFLQFAPKDVQKFEAASAGSLYGADPARGSPSLTVAEAAALTVALAAALSSQAIGVPNKASALFGVGKYLPDLRLVYARANGGLVKVIFPIALCTKWSLKGQDKSEGEVSAEFQARLDLSGSNTIDDLPYSVTIGP